MLANLLFSLAMAISQPFEILLTGNWMMWIWWYSALVKLGWGVLITMVNRF